MKTMKHFFKLTCLAAILTASIITLASFNKTKKVTSNVDSHTLQLACKNIWKLWLAMNAVPYPHNPDDGLHDTLQEVSHFDIAW